MMIMASKTSVFQFIVVFFLLSDLCNINLICCSSTTTNNNIQRSDSEAAAADDYNKSVSWNVQNHANKKKISHHISTSLQQEQAKIGGGSGSGKIVNNQLQVLDVKLRQAEQNKFRIVVSQDGSGNYTTITEAIDSIPKNNKRRAILEIKPGVYREKIDIPRTLPFVTLLGDPIDPPTITGNDTASTAAGKDGKPLKTFHSATVAVEANYFVAINIKFENTAEHKIGRRGGQAVAIRISGTKAAFYNCSFYGSQDTLYDHKGLHYFYNCFIQGSVDFVFGHGRSYYHNCHLNSVAQNVASLTAQKRTSSSLESGFSFMDCVVTGSGTGHVYLGRAWGDYSRVVFSFTYMDKIVLPQGWSDWGDQNRDFRVYYGEYKCSGPGANSTARVPWARMLTDEEAEPFIGTYYVEGDSWLIH